LTQPARLFRLADGAHSPGLACDATGLRLAGVPLLHKGDDGFSPRAPDEIDALLACAYGEGAVRLTASGLETVARALNQGDLAKAMTAAVFLRLPEPDANGAARLARADELLAKWDGQPHDAQGRFGQGKMRDAGAHQDRPPANPAKPLASAPHLPAQTNTRVATATDFATPKTPADAPKTVQFSPTLQGQFNALWSQSFPGNSSMERGGTIMSDRHGSLSLQNVGGQGGDSGVFHPDLVAKDPANYRPIGLFHTHPYAKSEGGYTGIAIDGGDAGGLIDSPAAFCIAQSGDKQFMFMKTGATQPPPVSQPAMKAEGQRDANAESAKGFSFADASTRAAIEIAQKYGLAYYEGSHGHFTRIYPK
jgi:hypothetical protein